MPTWTKEQNDAITKSGTNLIISAGAGSGKTAVLSQRVMKKLNQGIHINELLILTFTKKAAEEMKNRIRSKIEKQTDLNHELALLDISYITTFDSFCLSIVKKYHYQMNLPKSPEITEETMIESMKKEILRSVFDSFYETKEESFLKMINEYCVKNDTDIYEDILNIVKKLENNFTQKELLLKSPEKFLHEEKIEFIIQEYLKLLLEEQKFIKEKLKELEKIAPKEYLEKCSSNLKGILNAKTIDELVCYKSSKMPSLPRNLDEEIKIKKEEVNELLKNFISLLEYGPEDKLKQDLKQMNPTIHVICSIIKKYFIELEQRKKEQEYFEFNDIAYYALKLIKENPAILNELKQSFQEIMIDEYQDTNDIQEELIKLISNHNLYLVGDIKQSIYRFRNANPYLFKNKYDSYRNHIDGNKIDLIKNFRSREEVLKNINLIFNVLMKDDLGGADYVLEHQMSFGNTDYIEKGNTSENYEMEINTYPEKNELGFTKEEIEIFFIGNDIKRKIKEGYLLFDKDNNEIYPATYKDFVILLDRSSSFPLYKKIFHYLNIPISIQKEEILNDSICFSVLKNLLYLLHSYHKKRFSKDFSFYFTSVARSFLFQYDDKTIYQLVKEKNWFQNKIYETLKDLINHITSKTLTEIINDVYQSVHIYEKIILIGNIKDNMTILTHIEKLAYQYGEKGHNLEEFIAFLNFIQNEKLPIRYEINEQVENSVTLMTIHKSKGLEFPICYFAGLYKAFNIQDIKNRILYDKTYGFFIPLKKEGLYYPFLKELIKYQFQREEISEKIRLFYVALTRAKEKMIFVLPNKESIQEKRLIHSKSFADFLYQIWPLLKNYQKDLNIEEMNLTKEYLYEIKKEEKESFENKRIRVEEIQIPEKKKITKRFSKEQMNLYTEEESKNIELGIKVHEYLECIDFKNPDYQFIPNPFIRKKVKHFIESELIQKNLNGIFYKEYEFINSDEEKELHGIIDLLIEQEKDIILIDYKLNHTMDEAYRKQLNGYREFINKLTKKHIQTYLYSILSEEFVAIEETVR